MPETSIDDRETAESLWVMKTGEAGGKSGPYWAVDSAELIRTLGVLAAGIVRGGGR